MNKIHVDASVYYRSHFKTISKSTFMNKPCDIHRDSLKDENRISTAFNLLFSFLPNSLTSYMQVAANYDPEIFDNMNLLGDVNVFSKHSFENYQESKLGSVSRLSSTDPDLLIKDLGEASKSPSKFVDYIINRKNTSLLCVIENLMQINIYPSVISAGDDISKRKNIAAMLVKVGSTNSLISRLTTVGTKVLKDMTQSIEPECLRPVRRYRTDDFNYGIEHLLKVCRSREISNQIMLMISLYTICSRVLLNKIPTANHFDQEDISDRLSITLAVGVYKSCYDLYRSFNLLYPEAGRKFFDFAFFDDFYTALNIYTKKQAQVVACEDCDTPYLDLYFKKDTLNKELAVNDDIFLSKKISFCPNCKSDLVYSLYD